MDVSTGPKSWQDAFEGHPIQAVRALEQQLRGAVLRDQEKLRSLVGGSYRDLLSTADDIVSLDKRTRDTESQISTLGSNCRPPLLSDRSERRAVSRATVAAQSRLLSRCILCIASATKQRTILLSAELTVISTVLLRSLSATDQPPKVLEELQSQTTRQRRQLLRRIDAQLSHPASSLRSLVQAICAYCLITSASSADAIKHFRELRLNLLSRRSASTTLNQAKVLENLHYLNSTIKSLRPLLSHAVNETLNSLQRQPVLDSIDASHLEMLGTDQIRGLIPTDILTYTPYIKRVSLHRGEINDIINTWSTEAGRIFSQGLSKATLQTTSVRAVLSLRKAILNTLLPVCFSANAQMNLLPDIQKIINARVLQLCSNQIETLLTFGKELLSLDPDNAKSSPLWDVAFVQRPVGAETSEFLHQVRTRRLGTRGNVEKVLKKHRKWAKTLQQMQIQLRDLPSTRWQDIIEEPDDEDEDAASAILTTLSTTDLQHYETSIKTALRDTIETYNKQIHAAATKLVAMPDPPVAQITFLIRAVRETSVIINHAAPDFASHHKESYAQLHTALSEYTLQELSKQFEDSNLTTQQRPPSLPDDLPSPLTFAVLHRVCNTMSQAGGADVWSSTAVQVLKKHLRAHMMDPQRQQHFLQCEFDKSYLSIALSHGGDVNVEEHRNEKESSNADVAKRAMSYWNRTKLLFGPLA